MDQYAAFDATIALAESAGMPELPGDELGLAHLRSMRERIDNGFSESKLGRWLGWAQCAVVASGVASLEEFKTLNAASIVDPTPQESRRVDPSVEQIDTAARARELLVGGPDRSCVARHDDMVWKWATDRCPNCQITHREWLTVVKNPSTWLR